MSGKISISQFKGVIDTTLRDGQQSPLIFDTNAYRFTLEDKKRLITGLIKLGVKHIEFFSPIVSDIEKNDFNVIRTFAKELNPQVMLLAHCRCHPDDIKEALDAGFDGLNLYIGVSPYAQTHSHGKKLDEIIELVRTTISTLRKENPNLYIRFSGEDCFRTELKDVFSIYDEVSAYVNTFGMPDTVGIATPELVKERVLALRERYPNVDLECHFHNDRGLAVINSLTALQYGASYIDTTIWGIAERSGITSVTALLFNLYQEDPKLCEGLNLEICYPLNVLLGSILKYHVPHYEPVSATNRTHTAGVHQNAVLKDASVYEAMDLRRFGVNKNELLLGPLSGWNLIHYYLREFKFYDITPEQAQEISTEFKKQVGSIGANHDPEEILMQIVERYSFKKFPVKDEDIERRVEEMS